MQVFYLLCNHDVYRFRFFTIYDYSLAFTLFLTIKTVKQSSNYMRKVEATTSINCSSRIVIQAFTDYKLLRDWWNVERCLIDKKEGGLYTLTWGITATGFKYVSTGTIKKYNPENRLFIENFIYLSTDKPILGPMFLSINAEEVKGGSNVFLCQDGYQNGKDWDGYYNAVNEAWPQMLQKLKTYIENK